jgi:DNA-binding transcriptional LysR family regulator
MKPLVAALPARFRVELGARPFPRVECSSLSVLKSVVAESGAVGLFPLTTVLREVTDKQRSLVDRVEPWLQTNFGVVWPRRRGSR